MDVTVLLIPLKPSGRPAPDLTAPPDLHELVVDFVNSLRTRASNLRMCKAHATCDEVDNASSPVSIAKDINEAEKRFVDHLSAAYYNLRVTFKAMPDQRSCGYSDVAYEGVASRLWKISMNIMSWEGLQLETMGDGTAEDRKREREGMTKLPPLLSVDQARYACKFAFLVALSHELIHCDSAVSNKRARSPIKKGSIKLAKAGLGERGEAFEDLFVGGQLVAMFREGKEMNWAYCSGLRVRNEIGTRSIVPDDIAELVSSYSKLNPDYIFLRTQALEPISHRTYSQVGLVEVPIISVARPELDQTTIDDGTWSSLGAEEEEGLSFVPSGYHIRGD